MNPTDDLSDKYGGVWGDHPDWPIADWREEIVNNYTRLGYWDWVYNQEEQPE